MPLDPNIILRAAQGPDIAEIARQAEETRYRRAQMAELERRNRQQQEAGASLADLIASRGPDGSYDTKGAAFQRYTRADPEHAFSMLDKLDTTQREHVKAGLADLSAAVQWADSPEKWAVVQRHYAQYDPQIAATPFEAREQALVGLGQMGDYLKNTAPKIMPIEAGGSLAAVDPHSLKTTPLVLPNPGDQAAYAPATTAGVVEGSTATNPRTGERIIYRGGQWVPMGGGASNGAGNFRNIPSGNPLDPGR